MRIYEVKVFAILPWFAFLFAVLATLVSLLAWRRSKRTTFDRHRESVAPINEKPHETRTEVV